MRRWRWLVSAVALAVLAFAVRRVDWVVATSAMHRASLPLLVLAFALNGASLGLRSLRWWVFLRAAGIGTFATALRGVIVACGLNNLVVANGGEAARTVLVARTAGASGAAVLATVALDRLFDPICFALLFFVGTLTVPLPPSLCGLRAVGAAALVAATVFLIVLVRVPKHGPREAAKRGWQHHLAVLRECMLRLSTTRRFGIALILSAGVWFLQLAEYAVVSQSLGLPLPFAASVAAMIVINAGLLLRATPGGVGYFEFAYALAVSHFGISTDVAVAAALLIQTLEIIPVTLAALVITARMARSRQTGPTDGLLRLPLAQATPSCYAVR
jgi:uncharacterized protein (TIRG00374 family)